MGCSGWEACWEAFVTYTNTTKLFLLTQFLEIYCIFLDGKQRVGFIQKRDLV